MPTNLYDRIKSLEEEMNRIIGAVSDKKEEPKPQPQLQPKETRLEMITGLLKAVSNSSYVPSHSPRNFNEQLTIIDSASGTDRLYINVGGTWRYINLT